MGALNVASYNDHKNNSLIFIKLIRTLCFLTMMARGDQDLFVFIALVLYRRLFLTAGRSIYFNL